MKLKRVGDKLCLGSGKVLGLLLNVDGYVYFYPSNIQGAFRSYNLRLIADFLDNENKEWDEQVKEYFKRQNK